MNGLKLCLLYIMMTMYCSTQNSGPLAGFSLFAVTAEEIPSLREEPEFVRFRTSLEYAKIFARDLMYSGVYQGAEHCRAQAVKAGRKAFFAEHGLCYTLTPYAPVCKKFTGRYSIYVVKDYITEGSPSDNAMRDVEEMNKLYDGMNMFRIESPTILDFPDYILPIGMYSIETVVKLMIPEGDAEYFEGKILADPSCYTNSSCSYIFITKVPNVPADELGALYNLCGRSIQVDSGKSFYVLSHQGIGCKYFPNDYPVTDCWVEFTGSGELTISVTFVNFRESDQCDGFTMIVSTYDTSGSSSSTDLCQATAPTELASEGGKIRIEFGGISRTAREKYGFIIQVTSA